MQGDFSRWTFDPGDGYRAVLLQQGRVLLDADWNEQTAIAAHHDEIRSRHVVGRAGGPADGTGFAILDAGGSAPAGAPWADLRVGTGCYYVDGIVAEAREVAGGDPALADQPYLPAVGGDPGLPGLREPDEDGRYAAVLDVWAHHVTPDEEPDLLEPALGGPDTTTRVRTVWQVRLTRVADDAACADLAGERWVSEPRRTMTASLVDAPPEADPCRISTSGGYQGLENQLYRVQLHETGAEGGPTYLWSRENGSVVAQLLDIGTTAAPGMDSALTVDRVGRDDELSILEGDLVEVTSVGRELHGLPGLLATAGAPDGLELPVAWQGDAPADVAALGPTPLVRRWEGGPTTVAAAPAELEAGIRVAFGEGAGGVGDHWLVPARTVRLVYGVQALAGTIAWPTDELGRPAAQPPAGPVHHRTTLAVLSRATGEEGTGWTLVSDCRRLTPALTDLVSLHLLGGDGQESLPGEPLPEPVLVAVRNGGLPVAGVPVRFTTDADHLAADVPSDTDDSEVVLPTGPDGDVGVRWLLGAAGADTHVLTAVRLDDAGRPAGSELRVTGRRSVASQVAWDPVCRGFADTRTVQDALAQLATTRDLRLLGGDGQQVVRAGTVVPQAVRVVVDSPCGPVAGVGVRALASERALVAPAREGERTPDTLSGTGAGNRADAETGRDGVAAFWWQPDVARASSDVLDIATDSDEPAVRVGAHRGASGGGRTAGVHIAGLRFFDGSPFENDSTVDLGSLAQGIAVELDAPVVQRTVQGKPVVRVTLELPWPMRGEAEHWGDDVVGHRTVELAAETNADGPLIIWSPTEVTRIWLLRVLLRRLLVAEWFEPVFGRFVVDGWAIVSEEDPGQHLNGHAVAVVDDQTGRTLLRLPTDDEVTGGQFVQWFRLPRPE